MSTIKFEILVPEPGEQATIAGQTGSGKSVWMRHLARAYYGWFQVLIIDEKHETVWDGEGAVVRSARQLEHQPFPQVPVVVWRPEHEESLDYDLKDAVLEWLYRRGNTVLVVDEAARLADGPNGGGVGLFDITQRGRSRRITRLFGMQRPLNVPRVMISESRRFYIRRVVDQRDRDVIAAFTGPVIKQSIPDRWGMWYVDTATGESIYFAKTPE